MSERIPASEASGMIAPDDIGLAGQGDLAALRRLRDHWIKLALGEAEIYQVPKHEAQPQLELLAEMAAGSGEAEDRVAVLLAYGLRVEGLAHNLAACEDMARKAVEADDSAALDHWALQVVGVQERLAFYRSSVTALVNDLLHGGDANAAAMAITLLTGEADKGDERVPAILQAIMDSVSAERATAISAEVRKMEMGAIQ